MWSHWFSALGLHGVSSLLELTSKVIAKGRDLTLSGDDTTLAEGAVEKLKVGLLEEGDGRAIRVRGIGDDDVELVLVVIEELEAIADVNLDLGVLIDTSHIGEVLLGETDDGLC